MNIYIVVENCTNSQKYRFLNLIKDYIKKDLDLFEDSFNKPVITFELPVPQDSYRWNYAMSIERLKSVKKDNSKIFNLHEVQDINSFVEFLIIFMKDQQHLSSEDFEII